MHNVDGLKPRDYSGPEEITPNSLYIKENGNQSDDFFYFSKSKKSSRLHRKAKTSSFRKTQLKWQHFAFILLLVALFLGVRIAAYASQRKTSAIKREISGKISNIETKITSIQNEANDGNVVLAMSRLGELKGDIIDLKKFVQDWGQDIKYFQLLDRDSELTKTEKLLDSAYQSILLIESLPEDAKKIEATAYLGKNDTIADIKAFRLELNNIVEKLDKFANQSRANLTGISYTEKLLPKIDSLIEKLSYAKKVINNDLPWLSGEDGRDKNILIIFQNNRELRGGSGGSFGSFGVARIREGKLQKIDFGINIYKLDKAFLQKEHVPAPSELEAFGGDWSLKHAGFAVDGQEALDKIRWFYEKEAGEKVDGAIAIDTDAFVSLLRVVGPIEMPNYNKTLNADNFVDETMQEVQNDYFKRSDGKAENEPKKIIGDMTPIFLDKLTEALHDKQKSFEIMKALKKSLSEKHIIFNFAKEDLQKEMVMLNVAGTVKNSEGDYLYINNSNLAGAKSNQNMVENVVLKSEIAKEGTIYNNLSIERIHTGKPKAPDGLDRNYIRVLVPKGSKVSEFNPSKGNFQRYYDRGYKDGKPFWVDSEAGKTTINFWMSTMPQKSTKAEMAYTPDYKVEMGKEFTYAINFQRQPGAPADNVEFSLAYPKGYYPVNVDYFDQLGQTITLKFKVETDREIKIKFAKSIISE